MADKQDRWLDRETTERLLRGESPTDAVAPAAREEAERLARTLGALAALGAEPFPADEELPGEAAALKAFSEARAARPVAEGRAALSGAGAVDAGLVRIGGRFRQKGHGGSRWGRPVRFGLAAALAAGMVGGVAVAAGTGVLPSPFDGAEPVPGVSVSAAASPDRPLLSPSPGASGDGTEAVKPDGGTGGRDTTGKAKGSEDSTAAPGAGGDWPEGVASSCRAVRDGRTLDSGRRRILEGLAGGSSHVSAYCADVLGTDSGTGDREGWDAGSDTDVTGGSWGRDGDGGSGGLPAGQSAGSTGTGLGQGGTSTGSGWGDDGGKNGGKGDNGKGGGRGDSSSGGTGHH
ncbi:hypothetical protein ACIBVL_17610 [Streptomyces sp. NPDC049687]|uniref:hypothetical protein n=1 Tax=Streptomyces sp. NPDC049687 TaxID=3365596 RepID=UPI003795D12F